MFVLLGAGRFDRLRANATRSAFLDGAGPAAIGAILGSAVPLAAALSRALAVRRPRGRSRAAASSLRRGVVVTLLLAGAAGAIIGVSGGPLPH